MPPAKLRILFEYDMKYIQRAALRVTGFNDCSFKSKGHAVIRYAKTVPLFAPAKGIQGCSIVWPVHGMLL